MIEAEHGRLVVMMASRMEALRLPSMRLGKREARHLRVSCSQRRAREGSASYESGAARRDSFQHEDFSPQRMCSGEPSGEPGAFRIGAQRRRGEIIPSNHRLECVVLLRC